MKILKFLTDVEDKYTKQEYKMGEEIAFEDKRADEILSKRLSNGKPFAIEVKGDASKGEKNSIDKEAEVETAIAKPNKRNAKKR